MPIYHIWVNFLSVNSINQSVDLVFMPLSYCDSVHRGLEVNYYNEAANFISLEMIKSINLHLSINILPRNYVSTRTVWLIILFLNG